MPLALHPLTSIHFAIIIINPKVAMQPHEARRFRRRALEELRSESSSTRPWVNYRYLPEANCWASDLIISQLEILQDEGRVELKRMGDECMVKLTPLGRKSLEVLEQEWEMKNKPVVNTNRMEINNSTVGNAAQVSGSPGATVTQTSTSNELKSVHEAIDRLIATVKASPTIDADTKKDAQIEADQLKGEFNKTKPNPNRVKEALEWFKTATGAVEVIPKIVDVWEKVKIFLPGAF